MPTKDLIDKVNPGPFGSTVTNFAAVKKIGETVADAAGEKDFFSAAPEKTISATMFGEGSIGKVRFAGLAYMLHQEGTINLQQNAAEFFSQPNTGEFLEKKYPRQGEKLQAEIGILFSGDASEATLADLTTHRSGVGDLTRDQARLVAEKGVEHEFSLPELLLIPEAHRGIPRDESRPRAQHAPTTPDADLTAAKHGEHQYSNLGYMLLDLAMEAAYDEKHPAPDAEHVEDYKQLTRDYMLHPIEGPVAGKGLAFDHTKFPEDLKVSDNVARSAWLERGRLADATQYSGANAAGGIFTSADDSTKFFDEFFKGFPGTPTARTANANKFFSDETIAAMVEEGSKFGHCGVQANPRLPDRNGNERFQYPGFVSEIDKTSGKPISFEKGGGTFGYASFLSFDPAAGRATIDMCAQENMTGEIAKKSGVEVGAVAEKYRDSESGTLDRRAMIAAEMPELLPQKHEIAAERMEAREDIAAAVGAAIAALRGNGSEVDATATSAARITKETSCCRGGRG